MRVVCVFQNRCEPMQASGAVTCFIADTLMEEIGTSARALCRAGPQCPF